MHVAIQRAHDGVGWNTASPSFTFANAQSHTRTITTHIRTHNHTYWAAHPKIPKNLNNSTIYDMTHINAHTNTPAITHVLFNGVETNVARSGYKHNINNHVYDMHHKGRAFTNGVTIVRHDAAH